MTSDSVVEKASCCPDGNRHVWIRGPYRSPRTVFKADGSVWWQKSIKLFECLRCTAERIQIIKNDIPRRDRLRPAVSSHLHDWKLDYTFWGEEELACGCGARRRDLVNFGKRITLFIRPWRRQSGGKNKDGVGP